MTLTSIRQLAQLAIAGMEAAIARAAAQALAECHSLAPIVCRRTLFAGAMPFRSFDSTVLATRTSMGRVHNRADAAPMEYG